MALLLTQVVKVHEAEFEGRFNRSVVLCVDGNAILILQSARCDRKSTDASSRACDKVQELNSCSFDFLVQNAKSSSGTLNVLSGFDDRNCYGSVLVWNNDTIDGMATINVTNVPYDSFDVDVFHLDEDHMPGVRASCHQAQMPWTEYTGAIQAAVLP